MIINLPKKKLYNKFVWGLQSLKKKILISLIRFKLVIGYNFNKREILFR